MSLLTKSVFVSQSLKRCTNFFHPPNQLRLSRARYSLGLNNSLCLKPTIPSAAQYKERNFPYAPERTIVTAYFREVVQSKIANAYDMVRHLGRREELLLGLRWYSTLDHLDHKEFMKLLDLPDTFYSWFRITELHTWMLLFNLPYTRRAERIVRIGVINALWLDTERRSKLLAPDNKHFKKNMRALYERFQASLLIYDEAIFGDDKDLCSALWYNFYDGENVDPRILEVLVSYIRYQVDYLYNMKIDSQIKENHNLELWTPLADHYKKIFKKI